MAGILYGLLLFPSARICVGAVFSRCANLFGCVADSAKRQDEGMHASLRIVYTSEHADADEGGRFVAPDPQAAQRTPAPGSCGDESTRSMHAHGT